MTEKTGSQSSNSESVLDAIIEPWKRVWNTITAPSPEKPIEPTVNAVESARMPWERSWGGSGIPPVKTAPEPVKQASTLQSFAEKLVQVESRGNPEAKNPKSSATGLHQFTEGTWKEEVKSMGKNYTLEDRKDPAKSTEVFMHFTAKNERKAIAELGRNPQEHELYMYHLLGRNGAGDILRAPPDKPAVNFVSTSQAKANKNIFYNQDGSHRTVREVLTTFKEKFK